MESPVENIENIKEEALKLCQDFLGEPWREISISEFQFSAVSGGLSNSLYRCALPDSVVIKNSKIPREVLLRIYGILQEEEEGVVVAEAATFMLLAERKLGPKLFGVFPNGRLEEFIPSRTLKTEDYRLMYETIAREMAKIHALDVPVKRTHWFLPENMKKWLKLVEDDITGRSENAVELSDWYRKEVKWLLEELKKTKSPLVYCHNDLQGGNILLRQDSPSKEDCKLMLIDFEFGSYNYRGFDLRIKQILFTTAYFNQLVEEQIIPASDVEEEVKNVIEEIDLFAMAANLLWSLWSIKMSLVPNLEFAHWNHGVTRRQAYRMIKERYLHRGCCIMWNLITCVIVLIIFIFGFCFGFFKVVQRHKMDTLIRRTLGHTSTPGNRERISERLSENRRRNITESARVERVASGNNGTDTLQRETSVKSVTLPTYEELQPPSYDVAVHL
ncbi:hypothetical protein NPIL_313991 [Nephila pilipes]|uniref:Uncharacterized protein n=1 Tax=Nephila pilipes TaxID=299642 RepID=A0A8X6P7J6_NEPPI|nr:hypothetical protein NPIL_313991 [Nephila pilipes]